MIRLSSTLGHFLQKIPFFRPTDPQLQQLVDPIVLGKAALTANEWIVLIASFAIPLWRDVARPIVNRFWRHASNKEVDESSKEVSNRVTGSVELLFGGPRDLFSAAVVGVSFYNGSLESPRSFVLPILVGALCVWDLAKRFWISRRIRKESPELSIGRRWLEKRKYLGIFPER